MKRAAYTRLTRQTIDARTALDYGMRNDVVPRGSLVERAYEIADLVILQKRTIRRLSSQVFRGAWQQRVADDLYNGFRIQVFGHLTRQEAVHTKSRVDDVAESIGLNGMALG